MTRVQYTVNDIRTQPPIRKVTPMTDRIAEAQVNATLAIVEQLRISNLIALLEHLDGDDYIPRLREIEKTLGIEADHE